MAECERCNQMPCYCRQCKRRHLAEHFHMLYCHAGSLAPITEKYVDLSIGDQTRWLAVADAHQSMER